MDPVVLFLKLILRGFLKVNLENEEVAFVNDNIRKHRIALWINGVACVFVYLGLRDTPPEAISVVISSLIAPVMVLGGAWFAISFGGVPKKLIDIAMVTTLWMFVAFLVSLSAMFISVAFVTSPFLWPVLVLIYFGAVIACIQYDTADGLKAGLNEAQLKHANLAIEDYEAKRLWKRGGRVDLDSA